MKRFLSCLALQASSVEQQQVQQYDEVAGVAGAEIQQPNIASTVLTTQRVHLHLGKCVGKSMEAVPSTGRFSAVALAYHPL